MSITYSNLCSVILKQYFGESVQKVADTLFSSVSRTLSSIVKCTQLPKSEVAIALAILIKFRFVYFETNEVNEILVEYIIRKDAILFILRYPRYVHLIKTLYGDIGALLTEELLRSGTQTGLNLVRKCFASNDGKDTIENYRDIFQTMVEAHYLIRIQVPRHANEHGSIPQSVTDPNERFAPPTFTTEQLHGPENEQNQQNTNSPYFHVNFERFHQDFRDTVMTSVIERKLGPSAGECFKYILQVMYERSDAWQKGNSNSISIIGVKHTINKLSKNRDLIRYFDQYVSMIAEDSLNFLRRVSQQGGDQYVVQMSFAFEQLVFACIENVITEKFGTKASRIFRVIRSKNYIEQEDIQKEAMIPAKEAKLLTYKLFEEQFIQIKTIRKAGGGGAMAGPNKQFYLFHVQSNQVVKMLLDNCYKGLFNTITRAMYEKVENKRLMDKSQRLDCIVETMKERGESEEYVAEILETLTPPEREVLEKVKCRMQMLSNSEMAIDDTIFLLQLFQFYSSGMSDVCENR